MLATVVNSFNRSLIVVGGGVAQPGDPLLAGIREASTGALSRVPPATPRSIRASSGTGSPSSARLP